MNQDDEDREIALGLLQLAAERLITAGEVAELALVQSAIAKLLPKARPTGTWSPEVAALVASIPLDHVPRDKSQP